MMEVSEALYGATVAELKQGFTYRSETDAYYCLVCGESFEEGVIYDLRGQLMEAHKAAKKHIGAAHGSMLDVLLELDKKATGVTDLQKQLIGLFASGKSDAETLELTGGSSASTIRNHRFALKERAKQAKLFLAIIELMDGGQDQAANPVPVPRNTVLADERYALAPGEYKALLDKYLPEGLEGPLTGLPRKEKRRTALLRHLATVFKKGRKYKEFEVDELLKGFMADEHETLRHQLVDYGFLVREEGVYRLHV